VITPGESRLGIDFGTTHTVAALAGRDGRGELLLFDASFLLPSAVFAETDGRLLVGRDAERGARLDPTRFEPNPKRRIDDSVTLLGTREYPVVDLIAAVLRRVGDEAARVAGSLPATSVLTYPANWAASRKAALADAAARAGMPGVTLIPEPIAAALYFTGVLGRAVPPGAALVVYDFGGGTFDTSVLRRRPDGGWDVIVSDGLDDVGGLDLDGAIVEHLRETVGGTDPDRWRQLTEPQDEVARRRHRMLWDEVRAAKEQLSRSSSATMHVPLFDTDVYLTREEFERLARPYLERTADLTAATMQRAGVRADQVAGLFPVGGSSRIPMVSTLLHHRTGVAPTLIEQPELVVALGSLQAVLRPRTAPAPVFAPPPVPFAPPIQPPIASPVSPTPATPMSGPPVSAPPASPVSPPFPVSPAAGLAAPGVETPVSGLPPTPLWPEPAGTLAAGGALGPGPARQRGRWTLPLVAAGVVVLLVVSGIAGVQMLKKTGSSSSPNHGSGNRRTGGNSGATSTGQNDNGQNAKAGASQQTATVNKTVWYAGLKITVNTVTYDADRREKLTADTMMENLGDKDVHPDINVVLSTGGQSYTGRAREITTTVAASQKSNIHLDFDVYQPIAGSIAEGKLTIGRGDEEQAVVPLNGGSDGLVAYEPKVVLTDKKVTARELVANFTRCELRGGFTDWHGQAKKGYAALACSVDIQYTGGYAGGLYVGEAAFRLGLPDSTEIGPTAAPNEALYSANVVTVYLGFLIKLPASGSFVLRVVNPKPGEKRSPTNVAEVSVQL